MKRWFCAVLALVCLCGFGIARAESSTVLCLSCAVNGASFLSAEKGTVLTAEALLKEGETVRCWKINNRVVEGETGPTLTFTAEGSMLVEAVKNAAADAAANPTFVPRMGPTVQPKPREEAPGDTQIQNGTEPSAPQPTPVPEEAPAAEETPAAEEVPVPEEMPAADEASAAEEAPAAEDTRLTVTVSGGTLQFLNADRRGAGETFSVLDFTDDYVNPVTGRTCPGGRADLKVTAELPHASDIDYWVIDGVRYDFVNTVRYIYVTELTRSLTVEVVYKGVPAQTVGQIAPTGEERIVSCENAKLTFLNGWAEGGGYFKTLDFTGEYVNLATGETLPGGSVDLKVISGAGKSRDWRLNGARFSFDSELSYFIVRGLDKSLQIEAIR